MTGLPLTLTAGLLVGFASSLHCAGMCGAIGSALMRAAHPQGAHSTRARTLLLSKAGRILAYAAAAVFDPTTPFLALSAESRPKMPHEFVFDVMARKMSPATREFFVHETAYRRWALANTSLAISVLGGCLALWRYRRMERRQKKESP